ncbi:lipocalin-like domain-containing protein [[Mycobacterium] burgundiense]|uniref:Lipocalin-like domain-containing protein n=1 Tax=[Mycobacterium] burgundiense TaxID=3064286 RepID=A0ABM9LBC9_9MYCO|nr:lipocalin-like domain-containing protein [Mycolicibacterium sp. MU0053]CAJ1496154.1 lipocalin-like domain-containing protein [Mycolicibacterium sp. MU0053]
MSLSHHAIHGGWQLESFTARDDDGGLRRPLGRHPRGLILYTADGWMSAQLAPDPAGHDVEIAEYLAYGGRFQLDVPAATVRHDVVMSTMPELLARPQLRHYRIEGDVLTLSAGMTGDDGVATHSTLIWRR